VDVLPAESPYGPLDSAAALHSGVFMARNGFEKLALHNRERSSRLSVIMEARVLAGQPAQQPYFMLSAELQAVKPALVSAKHDLVNPVLSRSHVLHEAAQLRPT